MPSLVTEQSRWHRLELLFHRATELPEAERIAWARAACAGDAALLDDLLGLLTSHVRVENLVAAGLEGAPQGLPRAAADADRWLGQEVGAYRLERLLGQGGMGVVYLGHRGSGEALQTDFLERVAVKLMARHLSSDPALALFGRERDVLARLKHKNIARLLDAGVTAQGTPFVVMEYIEGRGLEDVFGDSAISLETKLGLMLQLCEAVSYVHRNLILHRDLKPANVMVTAQGQVKLLDFGTVKLLGAMAELDSEMTQAGMRPMTLRYASPEHIAGHGLSTASDVYSLGIMLYRLLAGEAPPLLKASSSDEHVQQLSERQLKPPTKAQSQAATPPNHRDLDAIALKAVRFAPDERYSTVDALAADLSLYLARRPVAARRGNIRYVAARLYQRNRGVAHSVAAGVVVLATALGVMRHQAGVAVQEHARAVRGIDQERILAHLLLFQYFEDLRDIPGSTEAQRRAATQAIAYLDDLTRAITDPTLELDSVLAYRKMGLLLGSPYEANLGDAPTAVKTLEKALPLAEQLHRGDPGNLPYRVALIGVQTAMAQAYFGLKKPESSLLHLLPMSALARATARDPRVDQKMLIQCAALFKTLADAYGQHADAATEDLEKQVQALEESGRLYQAAQQTRGSTIILMTLGIVLEDVDVDRAIAFYQQGLATIASLPPEERAKVNFMRLNATLQTKLGCLYLRLGRRAEAIPLLEGERSRAQRAVIADPIDTRARDDLIAIDAETLDASTEGRQFAGTEDVLREYLQTTTILVRTHPNDPSWQFGQADASLRYARFLQHEGQNQRAAPYLSAGIAQIVALATQPDADNDTLRTAAEALTDDRHSRPDGAGLAISFAQRAVQGSHPPTAAQYLTLAEAQREEHKTDAIASAQAALALLSTYPRSVENASNRRRAERIIHDR